MTERIQDWAKPFTSAKGRDKQRAKITLYIVFQRKKQNCALQSIFATKYSVTKKNDCSKMLFYNHSGCFSSYYSSLKLCMKKLSKI